MLHSECIARIVSFARTSNRYWRRALPQANTELQTWRARAASIPDTSLRTAALTALDTKRCDLEGAVAFAATFADPASLKDAVCAITSFQLAFDYLDCVVELQTPNPIANSDSLHRALFAALCLDDNRHDYYRHQVSKGDADYLRLLVDSCCQATQRLPALAAISAPAKRALTRIVTYQSLSHGDIPELFLGWAESQTSPGTGMYWWETAAATGSQLAVLALIAAAADPRTKCESADAIEVAYFPWVGALSTLLDSVIDQERDRAEERASLLDHYCSIQQTSERMKVMATEAMESVNHLAGSHRHQLLLAAMGAFFHSRPEILGSNACLITGGVVDALGIWTTPAKVALKLHYAFR